MNIPSFQPRVTSGIAVIIFGLITASCSGDNVRPLSPSFGDATLQNMANQVVNPKPAPPTEAEAAFDGSRAVLGVEAYRTGKVKKPALISSQKTSGGK
jgi:type IV pilus biogenesis protein CpaD/CtpE